MKRILPFIGLAFGLYILFARILPPYGEPGFWPLLLGIIAITVVALGVFEYWWMRKRKLINPPH